MDKLFKILVYGYGNPGRQDDGLGDEMVRKLQEWARDQKIRNIDFDTNYQLNIEDAELISRYGSVIFVDASVEEIEDFALTHVTGEKDVTFTTHSASPGYVLQLCHDLFSVFPEVYLLHIKGYEWEFSEGISEGAKKNLEKAFTYTIKMLLEMIKKEDRSQETGDNRP